MGYEGQLAEIAELCFAAAKDADPDSFNFRPPSPVKKQAETNWRSGHRRKETALATEVADDEWTSEVGKGQRAFRVEMDVLRTNFCKDAAREWQRAALYNILLAWCRLSWRGGRVKAATRRENMAVKGSSFEAWHDYQQVRRQERARSARIQDRLARLRRLAWMRTWFVTSLLPPLLMESRRRLVVQTVRCWRNFALHRRQVRQSAVAVAKRSLRRSVVKWAQLQTAYQLGLTLRRRQTTSLLIQLLLSWKSTASTHTLAYATAEERRWQRASEWLKPLLQTWTALAGRRSRLRARARAVKLHRAQKRLLLWRAHAHSLRLERHRNISSAVSAFEGWREHTQHKHHLRSLCKVSSEERLRQEKARALSHWSYFATSNVRCRQVSGAAEHFRLFRARAGLQQWHHMHGRRASEVEMQAAVEDFRIHCRHLDLQRRVLFWHRDAQRRVRHRRCQKMLLQAQTSSLLRTAISLWTAVLVEANQKAASTHQMAAKRKAFQQLVQHAEEGRWIVRANAVAVQQQRVWMLTSRLTGWQQAVQSKHRLHTLTGDVQSRDEAGLLQTCWAAWMNLRRRAMREVLAAQLAVKHILQRALRLWQKEIQLDRACTVWRNSHLARGVIQLWRRACAAHRARRMLSGELQSHRRQVDLIYGLRRLHWCATQRRAVRHLTRQNQDAREIRLAFAALVAWQHLLSSTKRKKQNKLLSYRLWVNQALTWTFRTWRTFQIHRGWCDQVVRDTWAQRHSQFLQEVVQAWLCMVTRRRRMVVLRQGVESQRKQKWLQAWSMLRLRHSTVTQFIAQRELGCQSLLLHAWKETIVWAKSERREALLHWRCWMAWRKLERDAMHELAEGARCRELRRGLGCLVHNTWRSHEARRGRLAAEVWIFGARSAALSGWRQFAQERSLRRCLDTEARSFAQKQCLRTCVQAWKIRGQYGRARKALLACTGVHEAALDCLQAWRSGASARHLQHAEIEATIAAKHQRRIATISLSSLQTYAESRKARCTQTLLARRVLASRQQQHGLRALLQHWKTSRSNRAGLQLWRARMVQLEWEVLAAWRESVSRKVLSKRSGGLLPRSFTRWQHFTVDRRQLDGRLEDFVAAVLRRLLERTVRQWAGLLLFVKMAQKLCHAAAMRQVAPCWVAWAIRATAVRRYRATEGRHPDSPDQEDPPAVHAVASASRVSPEVDESLRAGFLAWVTHWKWRRSKLLAADLAAARVQHRRLSSTRESLQHWREFAARKRASRSEDVYQGATPGELVFTPPTAVQVSLGEPVVRKQYSELRCEVDMETVPDYEPPPTATFGTHPMALLPIPESPSSGGNLETSSRSTSQQAMSPQQDVREAKAMQHLLLSAAVYAEQVPTTAIQTTGGSSSSSQGHDSNECGEVPDECSFHELPSHEAVVRVVAPESLLMQRGGNNRMNWPIREPTIISLGEAEDFIPEEEHSTMPMPTVCSPRVGGSAGRARASSGSPGLASESSCEDMVSLL